MCSLPSCSPPLLLAPLATRKPPRPARRGAGTWVASAAPAPQAAMPSIPAPGGARSATGAGEAGGDLAGYMCVCVCVEGGGVWLACQAGHAPGLGVVAGGSKCKQGHPDRVALWGSRARRLPAGGGAQGRIPRHAACDSTSFFCLTCPSRCVLP